MVDISTVPLTEIVNSLQQVNHDLSLELRISSDRYKDQANHHRSTTPAFAVGEMVWLLRCHIATTRPCSKLDYKKLGPLRIIDHINKVVFRLKLPQHFRIHNVFHASFLEIYYSSQILRRQPSPPPLLELL
jgi:hypothetical protein